MTRGLKHISGNCFWPANEILRNTGGIADQLRTNYHRYPSLIPAYTRMNQEPPAEIRNLTLKKTQVGYVLEWSAAMNQHNPNDAEYFVIYRVPEGAPLDITDPRNIVGTTRDTSFEIIYRNGTRSYMYGVTAVTAITMKA